MKIIEVKKVEILDFEKTVGQELIVRERSQVKNLPRYYASFENLHILEGGIIRSTSGNGDTVDEALIDYCKQISGHMISFQPNIPSRSELKCPVLVHTMLLNK